MAFYWGRNSKEFRRLQGSNKLELTQVSLGHDTGYLGRWHMILWELEKCFSRSSHWLILDMTQDPLGDDINQSKSFWRWQSFLLELTKYPLRDDTGFSQRCHMLMLEMIQDPIGDDTVTFGNEKGSYLEIIQRKF